jgi:hypothetical protein
MSAGPLRSTGNRTALPQPALLPEVPDKVGDVVFDPVLVEYLGDLPTMVGLVVEHVKKDLPERLTELAPL